MQTGQTRRVFIGRNVIQERNDANEATAQYTRDGNIGGILARTSPSGPSYFHYDGGGNVTALSDETGALVGRYSYDAFGNTLEASGPRAAENPYRFSTKEWHAASGMVDFGYRFYSPGMGRWLNRDPIRESGGVNLYAMVGNNSVNAVDAYGLVATVVINPGNRITIYVPIEFTGPGATQAVQDRFRQGIESRWTGRFGIYQVTTRVVAPTRDRAHRWNVINVPVGPRGQYTPNAQTGGYYGTWPSQTSPWEAAHEAGHLMGLPDRYDAFDQDGDGVTREALDPNDTSWNYNIMGEQGRPPCQADIGRIIGSPWNTIIRPPVRPPVRPIRPYSPYGGPFPWAP